MESSDDAHILFHLSFSNNYFCRCVYIKIFGSFLQSPFLYRLEFSVASFTNSGMTIQYYTQLRTAFYLSLYYNEEQRLLLSLYGRYIFTAALSGCFVDVMNKLLITTWVVLHIGNIASYYVLSFCRPAIKWTLTVFQRILKDPTPCQVLYLHVFRWFTSHLLMERVKETRRFHPGTYLLRWGDGYAKLFEAVFTFVRKLPCRKLRQSSIVNGRHKTY